MTQCFIENGFGSDFCGPESLSGPLSIGEILHRPRDAANPVRLECLGDVVVAQNHFCGATSDVDDQAPFVAVGQQVGDTEVDQPSFFAPSDHFDRKTQDFASL